MGARCADRIEHTKWFAFIIAIKRAIQTIRNTSMKRRILLRADRPMGENKDLDSFRPSSLADESINNTIAVHIHSHIEQPHTAAAHAMCAFSSLYFRVIRSHIPHVPEIIILFFYFAFLQIEIKDRGHRSTTFPPRYRSHPHRWGITCRP